MSNSDSLVYLTAPLVAWIMAQGIKVCIAIVKGPRTRRSLLLLFKSGYMPSSHSAIMFGLLTVVGMRDGFSSSLFAVVLVLTLIVIYDAANVRRAVGEQGEVLHALAKLAKHQGEFYRARGHRISEVIVGSLLGIVVGWVVLQIL